MSVDPQSVSASFRDNFVRSSSKLDTRAPIYIIWTWICRFEVWNIDFSGQNAGFRLTCNLAQLYTFLRLEQYYGWLSTGFCDKCLWNAWFLVGLHQDALQSLTWWDIYSWSEFKSRVSQKSHPSDFGIISPNNLIISAHHDVWNDKSERNVDCHGQNWSYVNFGRLLHIIPGSFPTSNELQCVVNYLLGLS